MKRYIFFFVLLWASVCMHAQQKVRFTHYTADDGLSQNRVMSIIQDKKGFMWFATWDGLNRFDGRHFKVYKGLAGDPNGFTNNRLNTIQEDSFGFIWILTNDLNIYRFNPSTERFQSLSYQIGATKDVVSKTVQYIRILPQNDICLLTYTDGCYLIHVSDDGQQIISLKYLCKKNGNLAGDLVKEVFKDKNNQFWFLTDKGLTLYNPAKDSYTHFFHRFQDETSFHSHLETRNNIHFGSADGQIWTWSKQQRSFHPETFNAKAPISGFCTLSNGKILLTTLGDGTYLTDPEFGVFSHVVVETNPALSSNLIHSFYKDMAGDVWLEADAPGVVLYESKKDRYIRFNPKSDEQFGLAQMQPNFFVVEDNADHLWVHPRSGGFSEFFRKEMLFKPFYNDPSDPNRRFFNTMHDAYYDKQGTLWMSTRLPGLEKCSFQQSTFNFTYVASTLQIKGGSEVRTIFEDAYKRVWVADKDGEIVLYDPKGQRIGFLNNQGTISTKRFESNFLAYDILSDRKGRIWIAGKGSGILLLQEKLANGQAYTITRLNESLPLADRPNSKNFYALLEDHKGRIWAGSYGGGLNLIDEINGNIRFIHVRNEMKNYPIDRCRNIRSLTIDPQGIIWAGTVNGIVAFKTDFKKPSDIRFYEYRKLGTDPNSLRINDVHTVFVDDGGNRWFGTFGGGLNMLTSKFTLGETPSFKAYTMEEGLPSDIVLSIQDDLQGNMWLFSENGITRFDPLSGDMDIYNKNYGLESVTFSESSTCRLQSGEIYAGTNNGFYKFNPSKVRSASYVPKLVFTRFILFNKEVVIGDKHSPLLKNLNETDRISLSNKQNVFTIEFAALDYRAPENIQYAYRLDPVDKDWIKTQRLNSVNYTNLSPGKYVFRVKSTNSEGFWMENERQIELNIRPSFWQTWIAITLYILFGIGLLSFVLYFFTTVLRLRGKVEVEQKMSDLKINFFTDISHELRTPLTLISGPVEHLLTDADLPADTRTLLVIVQRNINRMLRLINQLLDFRKIQDKKMDLKVQEVPFGSFIATIAANFNISAEEKRIEFKLIDHTEGATVWLDTDKMDTIVYNLLSNAFKFTPAGKSITLTSYLEKEQAVLSVSDTGLGISAEKQNRLFERFFSYDETSRVRGTGIGLNLVKELVEMHSGSIKVYSEEGKGSTFEVRLKFGTAHFGENTILLHEDKTELTQAVTDADQSIQRCMDPSHDDAGMGSQPLLLVVEDNAELRTFLSSVLSGKYRVAEAADGHAAWNMMGNLMPDFVITDLMMPVMDGLELTKNIKADDRTCHIPVIMLTAKSDMVTQMECVQAGVTDFIAKPFSAVYLEAKIENILKQRSILQEKYRGDLFSLQPLSSDRMNLPSPDSVFLNRIISFMEENMSNSELTVDQLVSVVGLGRTVFFNKLKGLLGMSPIEFIKETRIKRAAQLLDNGQLNVSEVSFQIGMNDARYFSKCFKHKYGMTPSEYKNKSIPRTP